MKLSKTSAHAVLAMAYLANHGNYNRPVQARQVAEYLGIPTDSALKILQTFSRRNLIHSRLGRSGGYFSSDNAADTTLLEVVEAVDGPIIGSTTLNQSAQNELSHEVDILENACRRAAEGFRNELQKFRITDLAYYPKPTLTNTTT